MSVDKLKIVTPTKSGTGSVSPSTTVAQSAINAQASAEAGSRLFPAWT